jgi:hypothetical protein
MNKYFYVSNVKLSADGKLADKLVGYFTDERHYLFTPSLEISRQESIAMIKEGTFLFLHDGCYRRIEVKIVPVQNKEFLRVDSFSHPFDYFG